MGGERVSAGVPGLDDVVGGGLPEKQLYLLTGEPGTGKTTMGLQFLLEGARRGERCLYLCLAETSGQLTNIAEAFGWKLDGIDVHELRSRGESASEAEHKRYTVFSPSEVELEEISRELLEQLDRTHATRLVLDSLSEIRLLTESPSRYRRELLTLNDQISRRNCTGLLVDVEVQGTEASVAETLVAGVIHLEHRSPAYGGERRRLRIRKLRASKSVGGYHDFVIGDQGVEVYPRMVAAPHRTAHSSASVPSGIKELDALLGGGLDSGTSTVLLGPAGTGKSTVAALFVAAAAARGERGAILCFDESPTNMLIRTSGLKIPLAEHVESGKVQLLPIDPAEFTPGELAYRLRKQVEAGTRVVVLDSINGYLNALPEERFLSAHLHELLAFLSEKGVATILTLAQHGLFGTTLETPENISYIADTLILLQYFEVAGQVKQALSVMKKRTGNHERSIRELRFGPDGVQVGPPLTQFRGVIPNRPVEITGGKHENDGEPSE
ncbi:MAG TPA: ATPase domain-containing protein [Polyangiaceae bacterium]|nr:ATPase domain-containing protein [Polyangiaceae bacterium]